MRVAVVGAGISGLTCAVRLVEAGHEVEVVAADPPARTTSAVAAALWYPYRALPQAAVTRWSARTFSALVGLAGQAGAGVRVRAGRELARSPQPDPWWRDAVPSLSRLPAGRLPPGFVDGFALEVPVVDMSVHLPFLVERLRGAGVPVRGARLARLEDAPASDAVVDCTGLGAAALTGDDALVPVRGQVVLVEQVGVTEWLLDQTGGEELTYVVPRERTVVLGGTAQVGSTSVDVDPLTAEAVLARCTALVPELAGARVLAHKAGLRPTRAAVRLDAGVLADGRPVVHDYGHGGAGVTLSWGCAQDVVGLVARL
jgi:D-amino-acid oxidase